MLFDSVPERYAFSDYHAGDVHARLFDHDIRDGVHCKVGMATAAVLYEIDGGGEREAVVWVPMERKVRGTAPSRGSTGWDRALSGATVLRLPEERMQYLFDAAVHLLVLHSPGEMRTPPRSGRRRSGSANPSIKASPASPSGPGGDAWGMDTMHGRPPNGFS